MVWNLLVPRVHFWTLEASDPHLCHALPQEKLMEHADVLTIAWRSYKDRGLESRKQMDWALFLDLPFTSSEALRK